MRQDQAKIFIRNVSSSSLSAESSFSPQKIKPRQKVTARVNMTTYFIVGGSERQRQERTRAKKGEICRTAVT